MNHSCNGKCILLISIFFLICSAAFAGGQGDRQIENLGRGVIAINEGGDVYIGWRMLGTDPDDIAFNLYRSTGGGPAEKLNDSPITDSTNWVDARADTSRTNSYYVRPVLSGVESPPSAAYTLPANAPIRKYISIPLQGDYTFDKAAVGDLDGDGEYDYVIKQPEQVTDPGVYNRSVDTYKIEAYKSDGTFLWRRDLGWNIVQGIWWSPMVVYDLDGDGRAEVIAKTAPTDVDYRRPSDGRVLTGPEWFSVFDGATGAELAREDWIPRGNIADWGDSGGNRVNRNLMCVAYLDGERPSLVIFRGTYGLMKAEAWNFRDGHLENVWRWSNEGLGEEYQGQGFHEVRVGDIDGDDRDEILNGGIAIDDDGSNIYSIGEGHGDRFHLADIDPDRPGLETWYIQEESYNYTHPVHLRNARTGQFLWGPVGDWGDVGTGLTADIDPRYRGMECWAPGGELYSCKGRYIGPDPGVYQFAIWWDGDPLREMLQNGRVYKWNYNYNYLDVLETAQLSSGIDKMVADVVGDWREEIITVAPEGGELRIYTTTIPSQRRFRTFMHDPVYRIDVACMSMGYPQSAHPGFYIDIDLEPQPKSLSIPTEYDVFIGNDEQVGPDENDDSAGLHIRDIDVRRRVAFIRYDISGLLDEGELFSGMRFSCYGHDLSDPIDVYGVIEDCDDFGFGSVCWNNAPGVKNDPTPPVGSPVELDKRDLSELLLTFTPPGLGERASSPMSRALDDFLNSDTDGTVVFLFAPHAPGSQAIIRSSESYGGTYLISGQPND